MQEKKKKMKLFYSPRKYTAESKQEAIRALTEQSVPDRDFYILVIGAILLAICGIFLDSIPVLVASMIVAPLATPILAFSLGAVAGDLRLMARSAAMLCAAVLLVFILAVPLSLVMTGTAGIGLARVFITFLPNYFFDLAIALLSGAIAAYGLMRPRVGAAMTGIGIAVSLMPPLVGAGIEAALLNTNFAIGAGIVFLLNVAGILAGSSAVFALFGFRGIYRRMLLA